MFPRPAITRRGPGYSRSANRGAWIPEATNEQLGFRVVLGDLPPTTPLAKPAAELNARDVAQILPKLKATSETEPYFSGPRPFVKIAPESYGPLFSWHNHSPGICECPNGDLLAVWYSCSEEPGSELNNVASRLRLGSNEWEPASVFWDGVDVQRSRSENLVGTATRPSITLPAVGQRTSFAKAPTMGRRG